MEVIKSSLGYGRPPWIFKGRALYQIHLVKAQTARAFIPKELKLVEAFGYTVGGFFLASYDESPVGAFDELVVMPGIVMNPPGLAFGAWASKVLVNRDDVRSHGREEFGLPSEAARFSKKRIIAKAKQTKDRSKGLRNMIRRDASLFAQEDQMDIQVTERSDSSASDLISIRFMTPAFVPELNFSRMMSPAIKISLPNFSGRTVHNSNLLNYSCHLECRVRTVKPAKISQVSEQGSEGLPRISATTTNSASEEESISRGKNLIASLLSSKPVLSLMFSSMKMLVEAPDVVSNKSIDSLL